MENFQVREQSELKAVDPRLEDIVNRMFQRCFEDKKFKQAIGIAIETRRLDVFEKAILTSVSIRFKEREKKEDLQPWYFIELQTSLLVPDRRPLYKSMYQNNKKWSTSRY